MDYEQTFAGCTSIEDAKAQRRALLRDLESRILPAKRQVDEAYRAREKALRLEHQQPFHERCKAWSHGDTVYFGRDCKTFDFCFDGSFRKRVEIEAGQPVYVWQYQPRKRRLWLSRSKGQDPFPRPFSLREVEEYDIRRTELDVRKRVEDR